MRSQSPWTVSFFAAILLFLASSPPVALSQHRAMTPEDLTRGSDVVAVGRVKELKSEWSSGKNAIVTRVTLGVDEFLKGGSGLTMTVIVPGGEIDGVGEWYSHTARFKQDEDVLLFAKRQGSSELRVTGGEDGKMLITKDSKTGTSQIAGGVRLDEMKRRVINAR